MVLNDAEMVHVVRGARAEALPDPHAERVGPSRQLRRAGLNGDIAPIVIEGRPGPGDARLSAQFLAIEEDGEVLTRRDAERRADHPGFYYEVR